MGKIKELSKNTVIFAVGTFSSKIIMFLLVPLYTNVLSTEEYGVADLIQSLSMLLVPVFSVMIQDAVLRFGLSKSSNKESVLKNAFFIFIMAAVISGLFMPLFRFYLTISNYVIELYFILMSNVLFNILSAYIKTKEKNGIYAFSGFISSLLLGLSNTVFLLFFQYGVFGYLLSIIISNISASLFLFAFIDFRGFFECRFDKNLLKQMVLYSAPLIINNVSWWVLNSSDKVMIEVLLDQSSLGLYTAATKIPSLLSVLNTIFLQAWTISSIKNYEEDNDERFSGGVFNFYYSLLALLSSLIMFVLVPFISIYVGNAYFDCWKYVPFLLVGNMFYGVSLFYGAIYSAAKKNIWVGVSTLVGAAINACVNLLLLVNVGVIAACISTAISYFAVAIFRMIHSRVFIRFKIDIFLFIFNSAVVCVQAILIILRINIYLVSAISFSLLVLANYKQIIKKPVELLKKFREKK